MKTLTQIEALKLVRKPLPPPERIIRPKKGGGYRRKDFKKYDNE